MRPAVVLLSKWPQPGMGKTRLHPHLTPAQAAALQAAFIADLVGMLTAQPIFVPYIAYSPALPAAQEYFAALLPAAQIFPQTEGDLGARMLAAVCRLAARGHTPVLVIGSDLPTLQPGTLVVAAAQLAAADVVIGPSTDGGYWLIGMNRPQPEVFTDIPWSTAGVSAETLHRARAAGLRTVLLQPDTDIDTWADVLLLHRQLQNPPLGWTQVPARTTALVAQLVAGLADAT